MTQHPNPPLGGDEEKVELVAWRYRYPADPTWHLTHSEKQARDKTGDECLEPGEATDSITGAEQ